MHDWGRVLADTAVMIGLLAKAEPKTLRYRLLHTAVRLVRGQRERKIKIPAALAPGPTRWRTASGSSSHSSYPQKQS